MMELDLLLQMVRVLQTSQSLIERLTASMPSQTRAAVAIQEADLNKQIDETIAAIEKAIRTAEEK